MKRSKLICCLVSISLIAVSCSQHSSCPAYQSNIQDFNGTDIDINSEWVFNFQEFTINNI